MTGTIQTEDYLRTDSEPLSLDEALINSRTLDVGEVESIVDVKTTTDLFPSQVVITNTDGESSVVPVEGTEDISFTSFTSEHRNKFVETIENNSHSLILPIEPYRTERGTAYFACTETLPTVKLKFTDEKEMTHSVSIPCESSDYAASLSKKLTTGKVKLVNSDDNARLRHISPIQSGIHIPFSFGGGLLFSLIATPAFSPSSTIVSVSSAITGLLCLLVFL